MAKILAITPSSGLRIEAIKFEDGSKRISIRQIYKTKKEPDDWKIGRNGITIPFEKAGRVSAAIKNLVDDPDLNFKLIEGKDKD